MALTLDDLEMITARVSDTTQIPDVDVLKSACASVWVGSGLAKISAAYGAALTEQYTGYPSHVMSALDFCQKPFLRSLPVLVSLKGRHEDAVDVAKSVARRSSGNAILITGEPEGPAALVLKDGSLTSSIVTASFPERDQRFVNCGSIFMLSALVYQVIRQSLGMDVIGNIDESKLTKAFFKAGEGAYMIAQGIISIEDWQNRQLIILGQGLGSDLMLSWQSVFAEAGIVTPIFLDIKDYTHGDHLAAARSNNVIFLVIQHPSIENICHIFASRFSTRFPVMVIPLESNGPVRFWENLFYCCNTADALTKALGYHGKRPPKDPIIHGWREWGKLE
ncbi:hypothetical protein [Vreelandella neptunia]|uniref:SIS domain-containing protein n=1 Tax=Vreelandella neptunia TaxID=115551 RepID=A0ABZ0YKH4_9GAMM|nr:hypothetical protein [Halomonas neptunia]MDN3562079.1 hypothetical protein [Halomonas neptunia]WQH11782.1 hypothetical protein SR894_16705 [Halomonas neptunia]